MCKDVSQHFCILASFCKLMMTLHYLYAVYWIYKPGKDKLFWRTKRAFIWFSFWQYSFSVVLVGCGLKYILLDVAWNKAFEHILANCVCLWNKHGFPFSGWLPIVWMGFLQGCGKQGCRGAAGTSAQYQTHVSKDNFKTNLIGVTYV